LLIGQGVLPKSHGPREVSKKRFFEKKRAKTFAGGLGHVRCLFRAPAAGDEETPDMPQPARKSFFAAVAGDLLFFQKK
jgi:hypothetical protein